MIESLNSLDRSFFLFLNSFHFSFLDPIMQIISGQVIWVPLIVFFIWYAFKNLDRKSAWIYVLFLVLAFVASDVTSSYMIKNLVNRLRPCKEMDLIPLIYSFGQKCGGRFGFVSSHAANSLVMVLFSARALRFSHKALGYLLIIPFLVSFSRIYLGVHYPGDILGGLMVGTFWGLFLSWVYRNYQGANR